MNHGFNTRAINVGSAPDKETGALIPPLYFSSTFDQNVVDNPQYFYSRGENPSRHALEEVLASLENANHGLAFSSGQAAGIAVLNTVLKPGDHILAINDLYGGTYDLFRLVKDCNNIQTDFCNFHSNINELSNLIHSSTKLIWIETPSNPTLKLADINLISDLAHGRGIKVLVDNTFLSPYIQNPLNCGADFVIHSSTKYISGHQDVIGGAIMLNDDADYQKLKFYQKTAGGIPSVFDCWLISRGAKTLGLRMEKHVDNAVKIAHYLDSNEHVERTIFPGLPSFEQREIVVKQMKLPGAIISFYFKGDSTLFVKSLQLFSNAVSLGGIKSLVCIPYYTTHRVVDGDIKIKQGITPSLIRVSVGIEDCVDLLNDLEQAILKSTKN